MFRTNGSKVVAAAMGAYLAVSVGCTPPPNQAISVTVETDPAVRSTCFRVVARRAAGGPEVLSDPTLKKSRSEFAFYSSDKLSGEVAFQARGFVGSGCDEPQLLNDESAVETATFSKDEIRHVVLRVVPAGAELDTDGDGYRAPLAGGPDCADDDPAVHPGAVELCTDQVDNDCDSTVDCADPDCERASCSDGELCTTGDQCQAGQCAGLAVSCDPPGSTMCAGARVCSPSSGACVLTGTPQTCDDADPCTTLDQCREDGSCRGSAVECRSPPSPCLDAVGSCTGGGACQYPVNAALLFLPCDGGVCWPDGGCAPPSFPYLPSNFDPSLVSQSSIARGVTLNCVADFDSTPDASTPFVSWCGQPQPELLVVPQDGGPDAVLLAMFRFNIESAGVLRVQGTRPVIFGVYDSAQLSGRLLATADLATPGPGGSASGCGAGNGLAGAASAGRYGGGGGAGFGSPGGAGGAANGTAATAGIAGGAGGTSELVPLRGGCSGGAGGSGSTQGGGAGAGGGAVQLSVAGALQIDGTVSASGGGGRGALGGSSGGGGAGSGGAVLLEASTLTLFAASRITANGGGGGEGASVSGAGQDGQNGAVNLATVAAGGSTGASNAGNGGSGAAGMVAPAPGESANQSGGGGGGAVGRIRFNAERSCALDPAAVVSPPASTRGCP